MQDNFPRNLTKGKIAETIFWLMFRDSVFTILPFGYEQVAPILAQNHSKDFQNQKSIEKLRSHPDFCLIAPDKTTLMVDIKYRTNIEEEYHWLKQSAEKMIKEWPDCYFFIATPNGFYVSKCSEIIKSVEHILPLHESVIESNIQNYYTDLLNEFIHVEQETAEEYGIREELRQKTSVMGSLNFSEENSEPNKYALERAGSSWSRDEDKKVCEQFDKNIPIKEIANIHKRSVGAIRSRLIKLGKIKISTN